MNFFKKLDQFLTERLGGAVVKNLGVAPKTAAPRHDDTLDVTAPPTASPSCSHPFPYTGFHCYDKYRPE